PPSFASFADWPGAVGRGSQRTHRSPPGAGHHRRPPHRMHVGHGPVVVKIASPAGANGSASADPGPCPRAGATPSASARIDPVALTELTEPPVGPPGGGVLSVLSALSYVLGFTS